MLRRALPKSRKLRVGIVGAGVAGLRCAEILLKHGVDVTVLEARNRVGGRLCQAKVGNHIVDLGPNWIHGTVCNPILDLVKKTETVVHSVEESQLIYDAEGQIIDPVESGQCAEVLWETIGEAFKHSNVKDGSISPGESLMDFISMKSESSFPNADEKKRQQLLQMAEVWGAYVGGTTKTQSLRYLWLEECLEGENLFVAGTYQKVLDLLASPATSADVIRYGEQVNGIRVEAAEGGFEGVNISTTDHREYSFDELVVTTPLGWLKQNEQVFSPALPTRFSQAIQAVGYGNLDKVYITFPHAWWNIAHPAGSLSKETPNTNTEADIPNMTATSIPLHQPKPADSQGQSNSTTFAGFAQFLCPTYSTSTNPGSWAQDAMNMAALPGSTAHPTLLFYTTGETSTHLAKLIREALSPDARDTQIFDFFKPYIALLPGYSPESPACAPSAILATAWENDPLAGNGSYTNFPTGITHADAHVRALRRGMPERGIWFAGEHTAPLVALGTVTGAWWSGQRAARGILARYGIECTLEEGWEEPEDGAGVRGE